MSEGSIGVLLCSWGSGKDPLLDMDLLRSYAEGIEGISFAKIVPRVCKEGGQREMVSAIEGAGVDRYVAVACSRRGKEGLYRSIAISAGLHPLAFEVANVRDQAARVHGAPERQAKAERLILMAVEKLRLWSPPPFEERAPASRGVAVVGDGIMAVMAAGSLASQGTEVHLVMSSDRPRQAPCYIFSDSGERGRALASMKEALRHPLVHVHRRAKVRSCEGVPGDFGLLLSMEGDIVPIRCGAVVLAPEPGAELRARDGAPAPDPSTLGAMGVRRVAILAGGSSTGTGCSCITPRGTLYALGAKAGDPEAEVLLLGREVRATGPLEAKQRLAQERGALFARIEREPVVSGEGPFLVSYRDPLSGDTTFVADVVLHDIVRTEEAEELAQVFGLPVDERGELLSIESRLRPGETVRRGVFVSRYRVGNMLFEDMALEAGAAAARASELLRKGGIEVGGAVAEVDQDKCSACLGCVRLCPYGAPFIGDKGKAEVRVELCQGCGACLGLCPSRAIDMYQYADAQLVAQERAALGRAGR